jgi:hypothetical protein
MSSRLFFPSIFSPKFLQSIEALKVVRIVIQKPAAPDSYFSLIEKNVALRHLSTKRTDN